MKNIIIGIGQSLRGDDAAGFEVVHRWQEKYPETASQVLVFLSEQPGVSLLDEISGMNCVVVVDAVQMPGSAGEISVGGMDDLLAFSKEAANAHGWGIAETLQLGRSLGRLGSVEVLYLGIHAHRFEPGAGLSPEVQQALTPAVDILEKMVRSLDK
jgi:hydrogenase maturation protease